MMDFEKNEKMHLVFNRLESNSRKSIKKCRQAGLWQKNLLEESIKIFLNKFNG
jgi:hypothetical protein